MSPEAPSAKEELVAKVLAMAQERLPAEQVEALLPFLSAYYQAVALDDLSGREVLDLYGAALAHWDLARQRHPHRRKIRVYNPEFEEHGWQSTHTVIEIVCDDMSFLVDSTRMELNRRGLTIHLVVHPVLAVARDAEGRLQGVDEDGQPEAFMHLEVDRQGEPEVLADIAMDLDRVLGDVRVAVEDWQAMREQMGSVLTELEQSPPPAPGDPEAAREAAEALDEDRAFLRWVKDDHFTLLGYRRYELVTEDGKDRLKIVPDTGLGILRVAGAKAYSQSFDRLPDDVRALARQPNLLTLTKANRRATVHRPAYLDVVGVKCFDGQGQVVGEHRFLGLYASAAYSKSALDIPLLRRKVRRVIARPGFTPRSHSGKTLLNILETYPRDELIQSSEDELAAIALGVLHLQERQRVRLFVRRDPFRRFLSCLVYAPRERYTTELRRRMQAILKEDFDADGVDFTVRLSESVLARIYFIAHTTPERLPEYQVAAIEARLTEALRDWSDDLAEALLGRHGEAQGNRLLARYREAFNASYRYRYLARSAVHDIALMERLLAEPEPLQMSLFRPLAAPEGMLRFKVLRAGEPIALSTALPMLEHMGVEVLDEHPVAVRPQGAPPVWVHDFGLTYRGNGEPDVDHVRATFQEAFARIWAGDAEDDGFNRLVLAARLPWRDIVVLRAYCKYLRQTGFTFSQAYIEQALAAHPDIARALVELFHAHHDPRAQAHAGTRVSSLAARIEEALEGVASLDEDRILRRFLTVIQATTRCNYFRRDGAGQPRPYLSFKLDPAAIPELPLPRPRFEVFVYSPRVEGVHLRGGKVARGGLRWSDRLEDFRTEVLGLMKAQMVKNALIVPVGAKGGFVVKRPPAGDREALMAEVLDCYKTFVGGLLDLTDNRVGDGVAGPPDVVRLDEDDPYLVVAADKGTATFSDTANAVAAEYGFWLGDAFASGGANGYDHKKMGITARGAWESVRRHFRALDLDVDRDDFSAVGIGDMSGDVFGNGLLRSRRIRLIAAFDHRHVFLDPDPDPEASFAERERLFRLPRSSWADYDAALISEGGGVWPRSAKSIPLSPQARQALGVHAERVTPNALIRAILRAPVDLLWNGGIGTYVKASEESHGDADDRSNDALRVDAGELRCKVVGEGGNLGLTQAARVEYALGGGLINTDFIDNSGGVDCSDHEVNIKILLDGVVAAGDLTLKQRNALLAEMTEEVAELVLADNALQHQALSVMQAEAELRMDAKARFMRDLERAGVLDRALEHLPNEETLAERKSFTRPEMAVLLAYAKLTLYRELLDAELIGDAFYRCELARYFPVRLRERFAEPIARHRLAREIVATQVANTVINRMGSTFVHRMRDETGAGAAAAVRGFAIAREVFGAESLWEAIEAPGAGLPEPARLEALLAVARLLERAVRWLLRERPGSAPIGDVVADLHPAAVRLADHLHELAQDEDREWLAQRAEGYANAGMERELALHIAGLPYLAAALDVAEVAAARGRPVLDVARAYFALAGRLELRWLHERIARLPGTSRWEKLARAALHDDLFAGQRAIAAHALAASPQASPDQALDAWWHAAPQGIDRYRGRLKELKALETPDLAMLSVAVRALRDLASHPAERQTEGA